MRIDKIRHNIALKDEVPYIFIVKMYGLAEFVGHKIKLFQLIETLLLKILSLCKTILGDKISDDFKMSNESWAEFNEHIFSLSCS